MLDDRIHSQLGYLRPYLAIFGLGDERGPADVRYLRQGLSAEAIAAERGKILFAVDPGSGISFKQKIHIRKLYSRAVVFYADERFPAVMDIYLDRRRSRIQAVFNQFLEDGCRPFYDISRYEPIDKVFWKSTDSHIKYRILNFKFPKLVFVFSHPKW